MSDKLYIMVCSNFIREASEVIKTEIDVNVIPYPAACGRPALEWQSLLNSLSSEETGPHHIEENLKNVYLLGGNCLLCAKHIPPSVSLHPVEQCFYLLLNKETVDDYISKGAYLISPGWMERWEEHMAEWGFTQDLAREFFHESVKSLVLLDTGILAECENKLKELALWLDLPREILPTGLCHFRSVITKIVLEWRLKKEKNKVKEADKKLADYAAMMDLLGGLPYMVREEEVIKKIFELFTILFAPAELLYIPFVDEKNGDIIAQPDYLAKEEKRISSLLSLERNYSFTEKGKGFRVRINHRIKNSYEKEECVGILEIENIAFQEYKNHYLNMALNITGVCGLAIFNARIYQKVLSAEEELRKNELSLKNYSDNLEELVQERTKELKDAQEKLIRQEKLAALGQLAGGVSHELRNPLGAISNATYLLKMLLPDVEDRVKNYLDIISSETSNADKIISDLLDFSRVKAIRKMEVSIFDLVGEVLKKFTHVEKININNEISSSIPSVFVDPQMTEQVIYNLIINACQAMPQGGELTLKSEYENGYVSLSITDTGVGISEENMKKIFDPLFTTKSRGIGFGLAVSKSIVEVNGGKIEVKSAEGKGSTFTLILPVKE